MNFFVQKVQEKLHCQLSGIQIRQLVLNNWSNIPHLEDFERLDEHSRNEQLEIQADL